MKRLLLEMRDGLIFTDKKMLRALRALLALRALRLISHVGSHFYGEADKHLFDNAEFIPRIEKST